MRCLPHPPLGQLATKPIRSAWSEIAFQKTFRTIAGLPNCCVSNSLHQIFGSPNKHGNDIPAAVFSYGKFGFEASGLCALTKSAHQSLRQLRAEWGRLWAFSALREIKVR